MGGTVVSGEWEERAALEEKEELEVLRPRVLRCHPEETLGMVDPEEKEVMAEVEAVGRRSGS